MQTAPPTELESKHQLTTEQKEAVLDRDRDLYVSAAAGSGKTEVLARRVASLVMGDDERKRSPIALEKLLVITFTRKAAAEMRERIETKLRDELSANPRNEWVRNALDELALANIMTIDAMCERIVRKDFHIAGVSPNVRVADQEEARELTRAATEQAIRDWAESPDQDRRESIERLLETADSAGGQGGRVEALHARVHEIRDFAATQVDPQGWYVKAKENFLAIGNAKTFDDLPGLESCRKELAIGLEMFAEAWGAILQAAARSTADDDAKQAWRKIERTLRELAEAASQNELASFSETWTKVRDALNDPANLALEKKVKGDSLEAELSEEFRKATLEKFRKEFQKWRQEWFGLELQAYFRASSLAATEGLLLLNLASATEEKVRALMRRRGVLGFNDFLIKALEVLGEVGGRYRRQFHEVLVDEYQDVSRIQDAIIRKVSRTDGENEAGPENLFIVGDVKQSIYRFRRADPLLFRDRLASASHEADAESRRRAIHLRSNFRSRPGILECANLVFGRLMDRRVGDLELTREDQLVAEREESHEGDPTCVEMHWIEAPARSGNSNKSDAEVLDSFGAEAHWIAKRLHELIDPATGLRIPEDKGSEATRSARLSDCAILVHKLTGDAPKWISALASCGIPAVCSSAEGLDQSQEFLDILQALKIAHQPMDDIALAAVLRSPMVGLTDTDLLQIRTGLPRGTFCEAVWKDAGRSLRPGDGEDEPSHLSEVAQGQLREFFGKLDAWRALAARGEPEALLDAIFESTNYEAFIAGGKNAQEVFRKIDHLREHLRKRAERASDGAALSDFLAAIESDTKSLAIPEEDPAATRREAVQIMTIHKSKGLEFPIVFVARLDSPYRVHSQGEKKVMHGPSSLTIRATDRAKRIQTDPLDLVALRSAERRADRGERLRLLYVAMTRAREKLILVGTTKSATHEQRMKDALLALGPTAPAIARLEASSPGALLGPSILQIRETHAPQWLSVEFHQRMSQSRDGVELEGALAALRHGKEDSPGRWDAAREEFIETFADGSVEASLLDRLREASADGTAVAPPELVMKSDFDLELSRIPLKLKPSQFKSEPGGTFAQGGIVTADINESRSFDEEETLRFGFDRFSSPENILPSFARSDESDRLDAAARGRLVHRLLEHIDLRGKLDAEGIAEQAARLAEKGLLDGEAEKILPQIPCAKLASFFASDLGKRLIDRPGAVLREQPFTRRMSVEKYWARLGNDPARLSAFDRAKPILVQGVIDCLIDNGDTVTLIDYKTDRIRSESDLARLTEFYRPQLQEYRESIRTIWRMPVEEAYLVFIEAEQAVIVDNDSSEY